MNVKVVERDWVEAEQPVKRMWEWEWRARIRVVFYPWLVVPGRMDLVQQPDRL